MIKPISISANKLSLAPAVALALAACGGGGGSVISPSPTTPVAPVAQAPTVKISATTSLAQFGDAVRFTWSSTDATSCAGSNGLPAALAASGSADVSMTSWGKPSFTITCTGAGGSAAKTLSLVVPAPLYSSSYENKTKLEIATTNMPTLWDPSMVNVRTTASSGDLWSPRALAIADFYQEGQYSMFVAAGKYIGAYPNDNPQKWPDSPGGVYFLRKGSDGLWIDDTAKLIKTAADRKACISNSYSLVADFNGDRRPDVLVACTGVDFTIGGIWTDAQLSEQLLFLSQPDGTYVRRVITEAGNVYAHQASAADIDGDGKVDVVMTDSNKRPFVLWGNGDGTFRKDVTRMPAEVNGQNIYGALLLPIDGKQRLILSGFQPSSLRDPCNGNCYGSKIFKFEGGAFVVEKDLTASIPKGSNGLQFGLGLDYIYWSGALYSFRVNDGYTEDVVLRTDLQTLTSSVVYQKTTTKFGESLVLINITRDGYLENFGVVCNQFDATSTGVCAVKVKLR